MTSITPPFTMLISGSSKCGKTVLTMRLIKYLKPKFRKIYWLNTERSAIPCANIENFQILDEFPKNFDFVENKSLIVLDDCMNNINKSVCDLFIKGSHHRELSVILILQNIFHQDKFCREISLNSDYIIIFKNPRDSSQIKYLGMQVLPDNSSALIKLYRHETIKPFSYIVLLAH